MVSMEEIREVVSLIPDCWLQPRITRITRIRFRGLMSTSVRVVSAALG